MNFNDKEDIKFSKMTVSIPNIIQWGYFKLCKA